MLALLVILAVSTSIAIELFIDYVDERAEADARLERQTHLAPGEDERRMNGVLSGVSASPL